MFDLSDTQQPHAEIAISGYSESFHAGAPPAVGAYDGRGPRAGVVLGLPPLHNHHTSSSIPGAERDMTFLQQGDSQCATAHTNGGLAWACA